jgi:uncharacterized protein YecT (DUF1311 family)
MRLVTATLLLAASAGIAHAADCRDPQSNYDMKVCANEDWKKADGELNAAYRKALAEARKSDRSTKSVQGYESMPDSEAMLRDAQRAWVSFRDANCKYQYQIYYGGSHAPLAHVLCMADMTKARVKELRQLPGGEEFEQ